jgi:hypothetical protein
MKTKTSKDFDPITWANTQKNLPRAIEDEKRVINYLLNNGYNAYSAPRKNKEFDIIYVYTADTLDNKVKTLELKTDFRAHSTNNIFVELYQNGYESGINTTTANRWCTTIVNSNQEKNKCICVNTKHLKKYIEDNKDKLKPAEGHQSEGFLIPIFNVLTKLKNKVFYV